jgi:hypothetical protein
MGKKDSAGFRIDFIGVGAGKSGTTWIADQLRQHPQVFIPEVKEVRYFNRYHNLYESHENVRYGKPLKWYHSFFKGAEIGQVCGEISPAYLRNDNCAEEIFRYNPDIKILVSLRDPVYRAFSNYLSGRRWGNLGGHTFDSAVKRYPRIINNGLYFEQLKRYFSVFPRNQIKVVIYSDLKEDARRFFNEIVSFLGLREWYPDSLEVRSNEAMDVRSEWLSRWIKDAYSFLGNYPGLSFIKRTVKAAGISALLSGINLKPFGEKPRLGPMIEAELREYFREDIEKLEKLLRKDLSRWK